MTDNPSSWGNYVTADKQDRLDAETASMSRTTPQRLDDMFSTPPQGQEWLIDGLLQDNGSVLLSAQYKSGKTTLAMNVVHALTTASPFLGVFDVPEPLRVAYCDLELGERTARKWFMDIRPDPKMATYTNLKGRGYELDLRSDIRFNFLVDQLRKDRIDVVIIDPISAVCAAIGADENVNADVRPLLDRFDAAVREAGCRGVVIVHHAGHKDPGRGRGASAFSDWASALWTLERDSGPARFGAQGRDVHVQKTSVDYDTDTRMMSLQIANAHDGHAEYLSSKRGEQITVSAVAADLKVSKPTAAKRLRESDGWQVVQRAEGNNPDIWEFTPPTGIPWSWPTDEQATRLVDPFGTASVA